MLIWRNLDPKIVAQLLVQASTRWKARNTPVLKRREGGAGDRPAGSSRGRRKAFSDV